MSASVGLRVTKDGLAAWPDLVRKAAKGRVARLPEAGLQIAAVPGPAPRGRAAVVLRFELADGRIVLLQTSLRAWYEATEKMVRDHGEDYMKAAMFAPGLEGHPL